MIQRRDTLKGMAVAAVALTTLPERWSRPLVNAVVLPAHAQTSCSGPTTTTINESLTLSVTNTTVEGPVIATRTGVTFSQTESSDLQECRGGNTTSVAVEFSGAIDSARNSISGNINILQTCGGQFVCEQISSFEVTQDAISTSDNGSYSGMLMGTLRCCDDF